MEINAGLKQFYFEDTYYLVVGESQCSFRLLAGKTPVKPCVDPGFFARGGGGGGL